MGSDCPRFLVLQEGSLGSHYDVDAEKAKPINRGEPVRCPKCGGANSSLVWLPPYRVKLVMHGVELGDFIKTTGDEFLVSERFARSFQDEGLMGLSGFHAVEVLRVSRKEWGSKPQNIPRYLTVTASIGAAALDLSRSRIRAEVPPSCSECLYTTMDAVHGFALEADSWRGEDIFRPKGLFGTLVVTERFERFVMKHGFTNMRLTPTEEYVWNPLGRDPAPPMNPVFT